MFIQRRVILSVDRIEKNIIQWRHRAILKESAGTADRSRAQPLDDCEQARNCKFAVSCQWWGRSFAFPPASGPFAKGKKMSHPKCRTLKLWKNVCFRHHKKIHGAFSFDGEKHREKLVRKEHILPGIISTTEGVYAEAKVNNFWTYFPCIWTHLHLAPLWRHWKRPTLNRIPLSMKVWATHPFLRCPTSRFGVSSLFIERKICCFECANVVLLQCTRVIKKLRSTLLNTCAAIVFFLRSVNFWTAEVSVRRWNASRHSECNVITSATNLVQSGNGIISSGKKHFCFHYLRMQMWWMSIISRGKRCWVFAGV